MRTHRSRFTILAALVALVAAACGGGGGPADPTEAVTEALERTFSGPFAFDLSVELDDPAREALVAEDPKAATFLEGTAVSGAVGDERFELLVQVMGVDAFEVRQTDATHTYLRFAIGQLAEAMGEPFPKDEAMVGLQGFPAELREAAEALLDGRWVAFVGDPEDLATPSGMDLGPDPEELRADLRQAFGDDPADFAERFTVVTEPGSGDDPRTFSVQLRARELARAGIEFMADAFGGIGGGLMFGAKDLESDLAEIPELVDGAEVVVSDRLVDRISVDVLAMARSAAPDDGDVPDGSARLVVAFSDHGSEPDVAVPDGAVEIDIAELMETFMGGFMGMGGDVTSGFGSVETFEPSDDGIAQEHVRTLAVAQETYFAENGAYTDSIDELLAAAQVTTEEGLFYGVCLHGGGDAYVIAVAGGLGASFFDSTRGEVVGSPQDLGCMPPLEQR